MNKPRIIAAHMDGKPLPLDSEIVRKLVEGPIKAVSGELHRAIEAANKEERLKIEAYEHQRALDNYQYISNGCMCYL